MRCISLIGLFSILAAPLQAADAPFVKHAYIPFEDLAALSPPAEAGLVQVRELRGVAAARAATAVAQDESRRSGRSIVSVFSAEL
jgi:hypothetical protein